MWKTKKMRVLKHKPMFKKDISDDLQAESMSPKDISITSEVLQGVLRTAPATREKPREAHGFKCFECGAQVPLDADHCPKCQVLYLKDVKNEWLDTAEEERDDKLDEARQIPVKETAWIHFSPESGTISYIENKENEPGIELECGNCGTIVEFEAERCPICGERFQKVDTGLVGLFCDMDLDDKDRTSEIDCPFCGEHILPKEGVCTKCHEHVQVSGPKDVANKVIPLIKELNVVFLHLDIESGEIEYMRKLARSRSLEHTTIQLESVGVDRFDSGKEWKGLSRI